MERMNIKNEVLESFNEYCQLKGLSQSLVLSICMEELINNNPVIVQEVTRSLVYKGVKTYQITT